MKGNSTCHIPNKNYRDRYDNMNWGTKKYPCPGCGLKRKRIGQIMCQDCWEAKKCQK